MMRKSLPKTDTIISRVSADTSHFYVHAIVILLWQFIARCEEEEEEEEEKESKISFSSASKRLLCKTETRRSFSNNITIMRA